MTRHVSPPQGNDKTFLTNPSICRRTTVDIHRSPGIVGFPYKCRHFYDFHVNLPELVFLSVTISLLSTQEGIPAYRANEKPPSKSAALRHVDGQKYKPFRCPHETSQTYVGRYLGQKQYLAGEVGEKLFNPTLMNKFIRIE